MTYFLLFLLTCLSLPSSAATTHLAKYCDCLTFQVPSIPVFIRSYDGKKITDVPSHIFQDCVDIELGNNDKDGLVILVGDTPFRIEDLTKGPVSIGVFDKAMHTFQIKDWDEKKGGKLQFSYLTQFSIFEAISDNDYKTIEASETIGIYSRDRTPKEIEDRFKSKNWKTYTLNIVKNRTGQWILTNEEGLKVTEIFGQMQSGSKLGAKYINGIAKMLSSGPIQSACEFNPKEKVQTHLFVNTNSNDTFRKLGCLKSK